MKPIPVALFITMASFFAKPDETITLKDSAVVFTGTTPCSNIIRPLHKIADEPDCKWNECRCMMVEWKLTLYRNAVTKEPTVYKLSSINRFSVKETNMYSQPGTKAESEGKWTILPARNDNQSEVYRLNPDKPASSIDMIRLSDNLVHILDHDGQLMIGNEFHSYTLSRVSE